MKLLAYLSEKGISQRALAKKLGVSTNHVNLIAREKRLPSIYLARKIENATEGDVPVYELLDIKIPTLKEE